MKIFFRLRPGLKFDRLILHNASIVPERSRFLCRAVGLFKIAGTIDIVFKYKTGSIAFVLTAVIISFDLIRLHGYECFCQGIILFL